MEHWRFAAGARPASISWPPSPKRPNQHDVAGVGLSSRSSSVQQLSATNMITVAKNVLVVTNVLSTAESGSSRADHLRSRLRQATAAPTRCLTPGRRCTVAGKATITASTTSSGSFNNGTGIWTIRKHRRWSDGYRDGDHYRAKHGWRAHANGQRFAENRPSQQAALIRRLCR